MSKVPEDNKVVSDSATVDRRKIWIAIATVGLVAVLAVGVLYAVSSQSGDRGTPPANSSPSSSASSGGAETPDASPPAPSEEGDTNPEEVETPPNAARETLAPVPIDQTATPADGVAVAVGSIEGVQGEAIAPGEVSGPALRITVSVTNNSEAVRLLSSAVVNVYLGADAIAANPVSRPAGQPFVSELAPGASAEGIFVFEVPEDQRSLVRIEVDIDLGTPVVIFEGAVS